MSKIYEIWQQKIVNLRKIYFFQFLLKVKKKNLESDMRQEKTSSLEVSARKYFPTC